MSKKHEVITAIDTVVTKGDGSSLTYSRKRKLPQIKKTKIHDGQRYLTVLLPCFIFMEVTHAN